MNRNLIILIVVLIVISVFVFPIAFPFVISGYGGMESTVNAIEYVPDPDHPYITYDIQPTVGVFQPNTFGWLGMCDLRLEVGQPQFAGLETTYHNEIETTLENGDQLKQIYEVRIAYFDMGFTIRTGGSGTLVAENVDFWIEVKENEYNVFQGADDVRAYILEIVTVEPVEISDLTLVEVSPSASGFAFDLESVESDVLPSWIAESGYQEILSDLMDVRFKVNVIRAAPHFIPMVVRADQQATWRTEIRVLVFGFWEVLSPYDPWIPGDIWAGWFPWLDDILLGLQLIIGGIFGLIVTVAIMRIPLPPTAKVVILCVVWIVVFVAFGGVALLAGD